MTHAKIPKTPIVVLPISVIKTDDEVHILIIQPASELLRNTPKIMPSVPKANPPHTMFLRRSL